MKIPYQLVAAVNLETRRSYMLSAIARGLPRLAQLPITDGQTLHIACYGPSLRDTWQDINHPCLSMSGATRFLAERGFIPDWHIDMDPRQYKVKHITPPVDGVTYLLASVCHPVYFDILKDQRVVLWHCVSGGQDEDLLWLAQNDPGTLLVSTGSNVGLGAFHLGGALGFRHFEVHGMDGSFADGQRHAAEHFGKVQANDQVWQSQGVKYRTSRIMANGVAECINSLRVYPMFVVFHGWGLQQSLVEEENLPNACTARQTQKAVFVRSAKARFPDFEIDQRGRSVWEAICFADPNPHWLSELQEAWDYSETLRSNAKFNTGSIPLESGLLLRAICAWRKPKTIIEVGTFIGKSTQALQGERIYTCDRDNDCFPANEKVITHPYMTSTEMFKKLQSDGVTAELFFFDGRLADEDVPRVVSLSAPGAIYVFDDYFKGKTGKGMKNVEKLLPALRDYALVTPYEGFAQRTTIAMLVPLRKTEIAA